jgi:8-amino-7-oxononanoate synthase
MADPDFVRETLRALRVRDLYRSLAAVGSAAGPRVRLGGREVLQFASNNYLGLAGDPRVKEAACRAIGRWGWGAAASRLLAGHTDAHAALEADLSAFMGSQAALVFPTGYQANLGVVTALAGRADTIVMDRGSHASLYDAAALAGARLVRYRRADAADAARAMAKACGRMPPPPAPLPQGEREDSPPPAPLPQGEREGPAGRRLLVTDTVFSMDGDLAPLESLAALARREGAILLLDEAHAIGLLGPTGAGLAEALGLQGAATARVGTLSKALGGLGGFVAASRRVCDLLVNRARPFIYTTALPAAACEAARAALAILRAEPERRRRVLDLSARLRAALRDRSFDTGGSVTPIVPIIVGEPRRALDLAGALLERGIFCPAVRPPTVPPAGSRLRISLTADHTQEDLARLVRALAEARA